MTVRSVVVRIVRWCVRRGCGSKRLYSVVGWMWQDSTMSCSVLCIMGSGGVVVYSDM